MDSTEDENNKWHVADLGNCVKNIKKTKNANNNVVAGNGFMANAAAA